MHLNIIHPLTLAFLEVSFLLVSSPITYTPLVSSHHLQPRHKTGHFDLIIMEKIEIELHQQYKKRAVLYHRDPKSIKIAYMTIHNLEA
jgi:hypothetical protein